MILDAVVIAVVLGIGAQVLAERFKLPAILPLLLFGMAAGPSGLGLFDPEHLGEMLEVLVHLGVAVILFEGSLSLDLRQLSEVGGAVRNLLTIGAAVTTLGAAALAHFVAGMPWPAAVLFGAIVMVTGPTVTAPLLRHMVAPKRLKTVITSEGLIIDALGATTAFLALLWVERAGLSPRVLAREVLELTAVGVILGFAAGALARVVARRRWVSGEIKNLAILAILLFFYLVAEHQAEQSGILLSVVMGLTMASGQIPDLARVKAFKGQLTVLLVSFVFVLLAAKLDLGSVEALGPAGLWVAVGLVLVVRPVSVFVSITPGQLSLRERAALAMLAPRGIVAAAVASLSALAFSRWGVEGGEALEGLVYLVILVTGTWATVMALVLPKVLGFESDPSRRRAVLVGASALTSMLGELLSRDGRSVVVVDSVSWRMDRFREAGHMVVVGDARDASTYEAAGLERDSMFVAATTNDALNLLVAELAHTEFGVEHPAVVLQRPPDELGIRSRSWLDLLGGRKLDLVAWVRWVESGKARLVDVELGSEAVVMRLGDVLQRWSDEVIGLAVWYGDSMSLRFQPERLTDAKRVTLAVSSDEAESALADLASELVDSDSESPEPTAEDEE